jgi:hypothetical protein
MDPYSPFSCIIHAAHGYIYALRQQASFGLEAMVGSVNIVA